MNPQAQMKHDQASRHPTSKTSVMLLPTKVSEVRGGSQSNDSHDGIVSFVPFPYGSSSHWTAQPVLKWIEGLTTATSMALALENASEHGGTSDTVGDEDTVLLELSNPSNSVAISSSDLLPVDQKRSATPPLLDETIDYATCQWDLSFVEQHDPCAYMSTRKMKSLAANFEQMMTTAKTTKKFQDMSLAYQMVQSRFNFTFDRIVWQNRNRTQATLDPMSTDVSSANDGHGNAEHRQLLDALYEEICQKLQNITSAFAKSSKGHGSIHGPTAVPSQPNIGKYQGSKQQDVTKPMNKHQTKQELGKYMTSWLRTNFTNPYPDDEGLIQMANHCGTTNQVISNWLINARTRKWRPAIIKATKLGRPADMLLEDSINIFDGKPVRQVDIDKKVTIVSNRPTTITPARPDLSTGSHMRECHESPFPTAKRQKRLHVVTTAPPFAESSVQQRGMTHPGPPRCGQCAPKSFPRRQAVEMMNTDTGCAAPKLVFNDEDDDGILLQSIQNAIEMESMTDGTIKFDTDFFASVNVADEETVDVDALSPTFFNISNLHQALSHYKF